MFFHPVNIKPIKVKKVPEKDIISKYEKVGLKPIRAIAPILPEFLNDFGWLRNDIQQFLRTSDPSLQATLTKNLEVVNQSGANKDVTLQDVFDSIVPNNIQTPAEIERFGRVLARRYEGKIERSTPVVDLVEKVTETDKEKLDVQPEV